MSPLSPPAAAGTARWPDYGAALAAVAAAALLRLALQPVLGPHAPFATFLVAALVVAWRFSVGPSVVAALVGALAGHFAFVEPRLSWDWRFDASQAIELGQYLALTAVALAICEALRASARSARRAEARSSAVMRSALDAIVMIDADDRVVEFNPAAERTFGYRREEALGRGLAELIIPPAYRERHRRALARYVATGHTTIMDKRVELSALDRDGREFPVELTVTHFGEAPALFFTAYLRDLTSQRLAEAALHESEARFRTLVGQIGDYAIFMMDPDGRPTTWNEGVKRVLGYDEGEFLGRDILPEIFVLQDVADEVPQREFRIARERGTASDDRWMRRKDGSEFFALGVTMARRDPSGQLLGYAKIMRDQTQRKHMENELRLKTAELSESVRRQNEFLALLSHELRNPLAPIRNAVEVLRMTGADEAVRSRAIEMMARQLGHLVRLVDDLLDIGRITSGRIVLRRERIELVATLRQAVEASAAQCKSGDQRLEAQLPQEPIELDADPTRLVQVVSNLLHNACKFAPGGTITVSVRREGEFAVIAVRDTGIGIEPAELTRIFEMFAQVEDAREHSHGGLGIGLALARNLVELHGGTLTARSEGRGKGAEFVVRLPIRFSATLEAARAAAAPIAVPRCRFLVVDDNPDAADSLSTVLRLNGHEVECVGTGARAVDMASNGAFDVALVDSRPPDGDVMEVAHGLRERSANRELLVIAMAGWAEPDDRSLRPDAGFDAHLTKPVEHELLLQVISDLRATKMESGTSGRT